MQARQTCSEGSNWAQDDCDNISDLLGFADLVDGGRAAFEQLFANLQRAALPPGAVVEIEFAVRRRTTVIPA